MLRKLTVVLLLLGVQGLADAFLKLRLSFESDQAMWLNIAIFETIYYAGYNLLHSFRV